MNDKIRDEGGSMLDGLMAEEGDAQMQELFNFADFAVALRGMAAGRGDLLLESKVKMVEAS
jgi:hypothetical protein